MFSRICVLVGYHAKYTMMFFSSNEMGNSCTHIHDGHPAEQSRCHSSRRTWNLSAGVLHSTWANAFYADATLPQYQRLSFGEHQFSTLPLAVVIWIRAASGKRDLCCLAYVRVRSIIQHGYTSMYVYVVVGLTDLCDCARGSRRHRRTDV